MDIQINCLVNRSRTLNHPADKRTLDNNYYAHRNYKPTSLPLSCICEKTLLQGYHLVPGAFYSESGNLRRKENWQSQQLFVVEFDDVQETSLEAFIYQRTFIKENAWMVTESIRSRYDDPEDTKCNGGLRLRVVFCMPQEVTSLKQREWIYAALEKALPGCDTGSANSITNGGLGRKGATYVKIAKIVSTSWLDAAITDGKEAAKKKDKEQKQRKTATPKRTDRTGELPLSALAKADPAPFLASLGLEFKTERGDYQHWGRVEKRDDTALTIKKNPSGYAVTVFANSIDIPAGMHAKSMSIARLYCWRELGIDIEGVNADTENFKDVNKQLADMGFGSWESEDERKQTRHQKMNAVHTGEISPLALRRKPIKLTQKKEKKVLATLQAAGKQIAAFLRGEWKVAGLRADTGTGKNHEAETYALNESAVLVNVPTTDLAVDLEQRMIERLLEMQLSLTNVFRRRGLLHRWENGKDVHRRFPHEVPCIQAARCDAYRRKGGNMYKTICPSCPVEDVCLQYGYRSQPIDAKAARMVITAHPDFHLNPANRGFAKPYLTDTYGQRRLILQDDISVDKLFLECSITKDRLLHLQKDWNGQLLGSFATEVLQYIEAENPFQIGEYLNSLTKKQKSLLNFQMTRIRITATDAEGRNQTWTMTLDEAVERGFFSTESEEDINKMPVVYPKSWTLLDQLLAFFEHYKRPEDAPIKYHNDTLTFVIPPQLHPRVWKAGFMSATLDLELFKRVFPKAYTENIPPVALTPGAKIYQLRTNRNPRTTVFEYDGFQTKAYTGLSSTGEDYWQLMIDEIARDPEIQHGIITYKPIFKWKEKEEVSDLSEFTNILATAHYGNLVGLDTAFRDIDVLWVLFAPEIPYKDIFWFAKMFYGNDAAPLNFEKNETTGLYRDPRLQKIWENAVIAELTQAIGRARLVRTVKKVVILTSHEIPGTTHREETILFDETDWELAGSLKALEAIVKKREGSENKAAALTSADSIQSFMEIYGCSKRHAIRLRQGVQVESDIGDMPYIGTYIEHVTHVTLQNQIYTALKNGETSTGELIDLFCPQFSARHIKRELKRGVDAGEIVKVRHGIYTLFT